MLHNVLLVPNMIYNLISVCLIETIDHSVVCYSDRCHVQKVGHTITEGTQGYVLYLFNTSSSSTGL